MPELSGTMEHSSTTSSNVSVCHIQIQSRGVYQLQPVTFQRIHLLRIVAKDTIWLVHNYCLLTRYKFNQVRRCQCRHLPALPHAPLVASTYTAWLDSPCVWSGILRSTLPQGWIAIPPASLAPHMPEHFFHEQHGPACTPQDSWPFLASS